MKDKVLIFHKVHIMKQTKTAQTLKRTNLKKPMKFNK